MGTQALLVEILLSAFFAIACFRSRSGSSDGQGLAPRRLFVLTDRIERLRVSRWQWCAMVVLLLLVLAQFVVFLALPSQKRSTQEYMSQKPLREVLRRS
jgi:Ca2+/Na+ antiporter